MVGLLLSAMAALERQKTHKGKLLDDLGFEGYYGTLHFLYTSTWYAIWQLSSMHGINP